MDTKSMSKAVLQDRILELDTSLEIDLENDSHGEVFEKEYSSDEERVSDYIQEITNNQVGSGNDPIGFLIASHKHFVSECKLLRQSNDNLKTKLKQAKESLVEVDTDTITSQIDDIYNKLGD